MDKKTKSILRSFYFEEKKSAMDSLDYNAAVFKIFKENRALFQKSLELFKQRKYSLLSGECNLCQFVSLEDFLQRFSLIFTGLILREKAEILNLTKFSGRIYLYDLLKKNFPEKLEKALILEKIQKA